MESPLHRHELYAHGTKESIVCKFPASFASYNSSIFGCLHFFEKKSVQM